MTSSDNSKPPDNCDELEAYNHTELYQMCVRIGEPASPSATREHMIAIINGEAHTEESLPMNSWRDAIMAFVLDHWTILQSQLQCPAKSGDPQACYECVDAQVLHCITTNPEARDQIEEKRHEQSKDDC